MPAVVRFVHRADVAKARESITYGALQRLVALDTELRQLSDSLVTTRRETQTSIATAREDMQKALDSLAEDLAAARKFMLQTAELGRLNQEMNVENTNAIRKLSAASQQVSANSAKLADTIRQLSDSLENQLKELAARLDAIQKRISDVK